MVATQALRFPEIQTGYRVHLAECEYRTVSKNGQIVCSKISSGESKVSPDLCQACPFKAVDCAHLRFSLEQTSPSPLIVRFNGRVEIWDDEPPEVCFEQAACVVKVVPISHPRQCTGCRLKESLRDPNTCQGPTAKAEPRQPHPRSTDSEGKIVSFPRLSAARKAG